MPAQQQSSRIRYVSLNKHLDVKRAALSIPGFIVNEYDDKITVRCPFHGDESASAFLTLSTRVFHCSSCTSKESNALYALVRASLNHQQFSSEEAALEHFIKFTDGKHAFENPSVVEAYHTFLLEHFDEPEFGARIATKGITRELCEEYRIGAHVIDKQIRFTIPVRDNEGNFLQVLSYAPNAKEYKFYRVDPQNKKRKPKSTLFGLSQIAKYPTLVVCGGPLKAILAANELNKHNIGAVSFLTGEASAPDNLLMELKGKMLYVCYDIDAAGRAGAKNVLRKAARYTPKRWLVNLPLDPEKYPKGDITDYIVDEHGKLMDLLNNLDVTVAYDEENRPRVLPELSDAKPMTLLELSQAEKVSNSYYYVGLKILGGEEQHLSFVSKVTVKCTREFSFCAGCPVFAHPESEAYTLPLDHPDQITHVLTKTAHNKQSVLKRLLEIPIACRASIIQKEVEKSVNTYQVTDIVTVANHESPKMVCYVVGDKPNLDSYFIDVTARVVPDETSSCDVLIATDWQRSNSFVVDIPTEDELDELESITPTEYTMPELEKWFDARYLYLQGVHGIIGRSRMSFLIDLTYHSILEFYCEDKLLNGWLAIIILGDTGTGKTRTLRTMCKNVYGFGKFIDQGDGSRAGYIGGMEITRNNKKGFSPGEFPLNDGGLLAVEEFQRLEPEIIQTFLTGISEGHASLTKIGGERKVRTRVRVVFTSNPRESNSIHTTTRVQCIHDLLATEQATRRFDIAYALLTGKEWLEQPKPAVEPEYLFTNEKMQILCRFAWTRKPEQVKFVDGTIDAMKAVSAEFSERYKHSTIMLVHPHAQFEKFARICTAFAALTYSHDDDTVVVLPVHVEFVAKKIREIYDSEELGYLRAAEIDRTYTELTFSDQQREVIETLENNNLVAVLQPILNGISGKVDINNFYAKVVDRNNAVALFSQCQTVGFIQPLADNKNYIVSQKWKLYERTYSASMTTRRAANEASNLTAD